MSLRRFSTKSASTSQEQPKQSSNPSRPSRLSNAFSADSASASTTQQTTPPKLTKGTATQGPPVTPQRKVQISYDLPDSPKWGKSQSASLPFDWAAARGLKPAPYTTPAGYKRTTRKSLGGDSTPRAYIRKKNFFQRVVDLPERSMQKVVDMIDDFPRPSDDVQATFLGGAFHFAHMVARVSYGWRYNWEAEFYEGPWIDWTTMFGIILLLASCANALFVFSRLRIYQLLKRPDPVGSTSSRFVDSPQTQDISELRPDPLHVRLGRSVWRMVKAFVFFLLAIKTSVPEDKKSRPHKVQQLELWEPGQIECKVFCIYSPAHALLWMATTGSNWVLMFIIMGIIAVQLLCFNKWYERLLKDRMILNAEVMHEYNTGFVYPRINPVRTDAWTMTNEAEMVGW